MNDDIPTAEPPVKKQKVEHIDSEKSEDIPINAAENDFSNDVDTTVTVAKDFGVNEDKYKDFVTHDELERLREFRVLDEVKSNDEDSNDEESDSSDGKSEDLPEDEIERMLNEDMPEDFKAAPKPKEKPYITRQKIVLEEKGINQFEVLPLDWMMARHYSGMPIYMHRASRVCTLSKPYFLGKGNTRRHDIPISAIPCLAYRRALEEEAKQKEIDKQIDDQIKSGTWQQTKDKTVANHQNNKNKINENLKKNTEINNTVTVNNDTTETKKPVCPFLQKVSTLNAVFDSLDDTQKVKEDSGTTSKTEKNMKKTIIIEIDDNALSTNVGKYEESSTEKELECNDKKKYFGSAGKGSFATLKHIDGQLVKDIKSNNADVKSSSEKELESKDKKESFGSVEKGYFASLEHIDGQIAKGIKSKNADEESSTEKKLESNDKKESFGRAEKGSFATLKHIDGQLAKDIKSNDAEAASVEDDNIDTAADEKEDKTKIEITIESNTKELNCELNDPESPTVTNGTEVSSEIINDDAINAEIPLNRQPVVLPGGIVMPPPRVETVSTSWKTQHLTHEQVNEYCKRLFKFKTVNIMHFKRWADRRKYTKARKTLQYPTLPEGTKLITIPAQLATSGPDNGGGKANKRDWVMNMNGRSYLSVFHEYVRRALQKQPVYEFKQLENASTPYQATVYIGGMQYGVGHGSSKRSAKSAAARASIHILIPEMRADLEPASAPAAGGTPAQPRAPGHEPDFTFFDYVGIEDPRITEFCAATCEPSPHAILRTCLLRNFGAGDRHIHTEMKKLEYQKMELTMKVGKHTATVVCKNKKTAKQRASQAILQALHPHVRSWGSLLRLYGSRSVKSCKEKKVEEQQITLLQDAARRNEPNHAVLDKLRREMRRLRERDAAVVPIGTLLVADGLPTHSGSNLDNVHL